MKIGVWSIGKIQLCSSLILLKVLLAPEGLSVGSCDWVMSLVLQVSGQAALSFCCLSLAEFQMNSSLPKAKFWCLLQSWIYLLIELWVGGIDLQFVRRGKIHPKKILFEMKVLKILLPVQFSWNVNHRV